jgi:cobalamin synthase
MVTTPSSASPVPPTASPSLTAAQATLPTLGATLGATVGAVVGAKLAPGDALVGHAISVAVTALFTGLFHYIGTKLGLAST